MTAAARESAPASVTAIVPAHNAADTLAETLRSILAQTRAIDEIIVVDDGSTDETSAIARDVAPAARVLWQPRSGAATARNAGAAAAKGDWLAFLDADDLWPVQRTAALLAASVSTADAALVHGRIAIVPGAPGVEIDPRMQLADRNHLPYSVGACLIRRSVWQKLSGMQSAREHGEDIDFYLRLTETRLPIVAIDDVTLSYLQHGANRSRNVVRTNDALLDAMHQAILRRKSDKDRGGART